ncbi:MAG: serine hydrolase domain-containing protein [Bryobacteraceae bacterium]
MTRQFALRALLRILAPVLFVSPAASAEIDLPVARPEEVGMSSQRLGRVRAMIQRYIDREQIAGAVTLIARKGSVVHFEAQGFMDLESRKPMQKDALFRVASMTKPVTSVAAMMLLEEGHFQLNDAVSRFIPEFKTSKVALPQIVPADREVTIRDLLTHTTGLPGARDLPNVPRDSLSSYVAYLAKLPLEFQPGAAWNYGQSTMVLGRVVEVASGMPLDRFFEERIFRPLGMTDSHLFLPDSKAARRATTYAPKTPAGGLQPYTFPRPRPANTRFPNGSAGLVSTAADYFRFCQMSLSGGRFGGARLLSRKSVEAMTVNQIGNLEAKAVEVGEEEVRPLGPGIRFGLGYGVVADPAAAGTLLSAGAYWWGGAQGTTFFVDPKEQMIGVVMIQLQPNRHLNLRRNFWSLAAQAIVD